MKALSLSIFFFLVNLSTFASLRECRSINKETYNAQRVSCFQAFTDPSSSCYSIDIDNYQEEFELCSLAEFYAANSRVGEASECGLIDQENYPQEYMACLFVELKSNSDCLSIDKQRYPIEFIACAQLERGEQVSINSSRNSEESESDMNISQQAKRISSSTSLK